MKKAEYEKQAAKLYNWIHGDGESGRIFFVNGYVGCKISTNALKLIITEAQGGNSNYPGDMVEINYEDIESMEFIADEYKFSVNTYGESIHDGQGYDFEVYTLERVYIDHE